LLFHYIQKHHYLGYGVAVGQKLEYLVRDGQGRELACLVFSAAAWKVQCRDQFIGWSHEQRRRHLGADCQQQPFSHFAEDCDILLYLTSFGLQKQLRLFIRRGRTACPDWNAGHGSLKRSAC